MSTEILIVEDNIPTLITLKKFLRKCSYTVYHREDGQEAIDLIKQRAYQWDLIVLDVVLPGLNGLDVLKKTRESEINVPILLLTSMGDTQSIVKGLDLGADDYLVKPFAIAELQARLRSLLRRDTKVSKDTLVKGSFQLNPLEKTCNFQDRKLKLTTKEFDLLKFFLTFPNQPLSRDYILLNVWNMDNMPSPNSIDVHIRRLREKLGDTQAKLLQTVHGIGYKLNEHV